MRNGIKTKTALGKAIYGENGKAVKIHTERNGLRPLKTAIVALFIVAQIAVIIFLHVRAGMLFKVYAVVSFILSFCMCFVCLSSSKNGLSKAVWTIILLLGFTFGFVLYILSDERFFFRKAKKRYKSIYAAADGFCPEKKNVDACAAVKNDCEYLYSAGKFGAYEDTEIKYFSSGASFFDDVIERLSSAEKFIFIEFFIVADGVLLNRILGVLEEKAKNGADVRVIYDDMGSHSVLSRRMKKRILRAGIKLTAFNRLYPLFNVGLNYRDHRKIIVIDGKTAYSGGCNLADEYINEKRMHGYWKDSGVRLDGSAVDAFSLIFLRQWEFLTHKKEDYSKFFGLYEKVNNAAVVAPFADGLDFEMPIGKNMYENVISGANERIYIMTPYFIPDETVSGLIKNKAASGVDVRIILPEVPDKAFTYAVSRNNAEKLIPYGVKVYCMKNSFVHSKLCLSEKCAVIGSVNFDLRSFYQQFECAVYTNDEKVLKAVAADFDDVFDKSVVIDEKNARRAKLVNRVIAGILQLFAPLM